MAREVGLSLIRGCFETPSKKARVVGLACFCGNRGVVQLNSRGGWVAKLEVPGASKCVNSISIESVELS